MLLGIDIGTSSMKIGIYDGTGQEHYLNRISYQPCYPKEGLAEMDPLVWWRSLITLLLSCPQELRDQVKALSFSGQMHGVVAVDAQIKPLFPAVLWLDCRGQNELKLFPNTLLDNHGNEPYLGAMGVTLLWLKQHNADIYEKTHQFLSPKDWLRAYITGQFNTEISDASGTLLTNDSGQWDKNLIQKLGLNVQQLPEIVSSVEPVGQLLKEKAACLGLPDNVIVVAGGGDTACATLGAGLNHNGHQMMLTIGTGIQLLNVSSTFPTPQRTLNIFACPNVVKNQQSWYQMAALLNGGSVLEWMKNLFQISWGEMYQIAFADVDQYDDLNIVALPWLNGERVSLAKKQPSAGWVKIKAHHTRNEMIYAMFRSIALSIRLGLETFSQHESIEEIIFAGGGSVDPAWRQLIANALNKKLICLENADLSVRGAAMLAGLGSQSLSVTEAETFIPKMVMIINPEQSKVHSLLNHKTRLLEEYYV